MSDSSAPEYAKGLEGVIANESKLSQVLGMDGVLRYLGYNIDDLVEHTTFEEVLYLLHRGALPTQAELDEMTGTLRSLRSLPEGVIEFLKSAPKDAGPMDVLRTGVSMLGLSDTRGKNQDRPLNEERALAICAQDPDDRRLLPPRPPGARPAAGPRRPQRGRAFSLPDQRRGALSGSHQDPRRRLHSARRPRHECIDLQRPGHDRHAE